ncbi:hypothetical protein AXF42_Ash011676 [Apostasia shenzhenica]|uniref:HTH OST-type domain-containing protein n=1 Tax=Apostasia shenzhenica TaxID=1088818 RepID=A0A2H9ZUM8_9ASPA|nr:hypothetical protein AXF42_Ash011676 [Apostasia shenzhenica]
MENLLCRSLIFHLSPSSPPLSPRLLCLRLLLLRSYAGDEAHWRRSDGHSVSSTYPNFTSSFHSRRNHDEENRNVKISAWWDFENCGIPLGVNVHRVANRITWALRSSGIKGPVTITAFGDVAQLSRSTQEALTSTGVCLTHVPYNGKNSSDRSFMADIVYWVSQNPPPAHFFLISGDKDFANILHRLRMSNYNILLASSERASGVLCSSATIMWPWNGLVRGEDVAGKHFNYPPDGLYGSWYGHHKGALDDPFADSELPTTHNAEKSMESIPEMKPRPIPKAVVNGIRHILHFYPEGIRLSDLGQELKKYNITMDKDYFGHRRFSHLLSSLPNIVTLLPPPAGELQPLVIGKHKKGAEKLELGTRPAKEIDTSGSDKENGNSIEDLKRIECESPFSIKNNNFHNSAIASTSGKYDQAIVNTESHKGTSVQSKGDETIVEGGRPESNSTNFTGPPPSISHLSSTSQQTDNMGLKERFIKKIWMSLMARRVSSEEDNSIGDVDSSKHEDLSTNAPNISIWCFKKEKPMVNNAYPQKNVSEKQSSETSSLHVDKSVTIDKTSGPPEKDEYADQQSVGLYGRIVRWWKSKISSKNDQVVTTESIEKVICETDAVHESSKHMSCSSIDPTAQDHFSKPGFWDDLESFLLTSKGCDLILISKTRKQLAQNLCDEGPQHLKDLSENHLLQLVDALIVEKKWVEESASQLFPFRIPLPDRRSCIPFHPNRSSGLSSIFSRSPRFVLRKPLNQVNQVQNSLASAKPSIEIADTKPPFNFTELKVWFQNNFDSESRSHIEPDDVQKLFENKFNRKLCSLSYGFSDMQNLIEVCLTDANDAHVKKGPPRREEVLSDCQKLLQELLEKYPNGFNIGIFRPEFIQKYGYILNYQMLGYPKLLSLLQIMPGVRVKLSRVFPAEIANQVSDSNQEDDKDNPVENGNSEDSSWEELGPISDSATLEQKHGLEKEAIFPEASLSDDEFSDSEEDLPSPACKSGDNKQDDEDSTLLKILSSWHESKECGAKEQDKDLDVLVDCLRADTFKNSDTATGSLKKVKVKAHKRYTFTADDVGDGKERFVDSVLAKLQKPGNQRLRS